LETGETQSPEFQPAMMAYPEKRSSATVMIGIETATPAAAKTSARI
jgi:hypothetical protein